MKTKVKKFLKWQRVIAVVLLCALIGVSHARFTSAQSLTESFASDTVLQRGMIVKRTEDPKKIELVSQEKASEVFGIVINANDSPLTLSEENQPYFVATVGTFEVLVSTQEGPVNKGDYIAVSSIDGIGMAATQRDEHIVGLAVSDFDGSKDVVSTPVLKRPSGEEVLPVGRVMLDIGIGKNPNHRTRSADVPTSLSRLTTALAGKEVSPFRVYISVLIFLVSSVTVMAMLYAGIRNAMVSIGRNPLGKKGITRGLLQVVFAGLIVFISGLIGVYLILRL